MVVTYAELKAQAKEVLRRAEEARLTELNAVLADVRIKVAEYELTPEQIFGRVGSRNIRRKVVAPKYQDPNTGATWSGRGREPGWIRGKKRELFLIADK